MITANITPALRNALCIAMSAALLSCGGTEQKPAEVQAEKPKPYERISPEFSADSAYYFVEKQLTFGPRVTNTEAHKKCGDWMVTELKKYTDRVVEQRARVTNFDGKPLDIRNIIGVINPKATRRILLCAHWDSRPYADEDQIDRDKPILGANDGASGVAVLMQLAAVLKYKPVDVGVDIVLFDAEDLGKSQFEDS
ncbi:MAG: M28 family peptidase, partial [Bacteroidota bacterium]